MEGALRLLNEMVSTGLIETYAVGGAMAALFYSEPVATYDLDVFVVLPGAQRRAAIVTLEPQLAFMKERGAIPQKEQVIVEGIPVQLLPAWNELIIEATNQAVVRRVGSTEARICREEHLIAILLQTGRAKDRARLPLLLEGTAPDRPLLREILDRYGLRQRWTAWTGQSDV